MLKNGRPAMTPVSIVRDTPSKAAAMAACGPAAVRTSVDEQLKAGWHSSLAEGLAVARREQKPVLIDMWATWCKNCLTMDKTTLANDSVRQALSGYVRIKFQAEDPDAQPARDILQRLSAPGLPAYAILKPKP
jgi:thiol:disulfide interchange protein